MRIRTNPIKDMAIPVMFLEQLLRNSASTPEIRTAIKKYYRKASQILHPDKNGGDETFAEGFKSISTGFGTVEDISDDALMQYIQSYVQGTQNQGSATSQTSGETHLRSQIAGLQRELTEIRRRASQAERNARDYQDEASRAQNRVRREIETRRSVEERLETLTTESGQYKKAAEDAKSESSRAKQRASQLERQLEAEKGSIEAMVNGAEQLIRNQRTTYTEKVGKLEAELGNIKSKDTTAEQILAKGVKARDAGDKKGALEYFTLLTELNPGNVHAHYFAATIYLGQGNLELAGRHAKSIVDVSPGHTSGRSLYERITGQLVQQIESGRKAKDQQTVVETCSTWLKFDPENHHAHYFAGTAYEALGNLQEAARHYKSAGNGTSAKQGLNRVKTRSP